jgi:hypothetical protein
VCVCVRVCVCVCVCVCETSRRDGGKLMVELCGLDWKSSMMPCCMATCTSLLCQKRPRVCQKKPAKGTYIYICIYV